jgi:glucokinase
MRRATAIGVDVGGTQVRAGQVSAAGDVLAWAAQPTEADPTRVVAQIGALVREIDAPDVAAIGVGVPGRVDARQGRILSGGYIDLSGHSLSHILGRALGRPVTVDNDGNQALFGEHAVGSARSAETAVMFTIGTGIGGAVIAHGSLLRGKNAAGQLGHLAIDRSGELCLCGRCGCVETTSSGTALRRHIAAAGLPRATTVESLLAQSASGDATARGVIAAWAAPMRIAIDTVVAAFDPDMVVLGGGLGAAMHRALADFPAVAPWYQCAVVPATLGDRAGVIGAALSALAALKDPVGAPQ